MNPVQRTSSARPSNLPVSVVPLTRVELNGLIITMRQASTPHSINVTMNPTQQQASPARSTLPVAVVPSASLAKTNGPPIGSCVPLAPNTRGLQNLRFWPAKRRFLGYVSKPEGRPACVGGYSDVWRCGVRFSTPSEGLPREVRPSTIVLH